MLHRARDWFLLRSSQQSDVPAGGDVIGYLQDAKNNHMVELVEKLTPEDCALIFEHYNFACLKEVTP